MTKYLVVAILAMGLGAPAFAETEKGTDTNKGREPEKQAESKAAQPEKPSAQPKASKTQTPFGPVATTSAPEEALPRRELSSDSSVTAEEQGEEVVFRRKTPFGDQVWRKKKTELNADERSILGRGAAPSQKPRPAKSEAEKQGSKPETAGKP